MVSQLSQEHGIDFVHFRARFKGLKSSRLQDERPDLSGIGSRNPKLCTVKPLVSPPYPFLTLRMASVLVGQ